MSTFLLNYITLSLTISYLVLTHGCDYHYDGPIVFETNNLIDRLVLGEVIEISFKLLINETCPTGWCYILKLKDDDDVNLRVPVINMPSDSGGIRAVMSDLNGKTSGYDIIDESFISTFTDGIYHDYYFKWEINKRLFMFDGIVIYESNGIYDFSQYQNKEYGLYIGSGGGYIVDASMTDLCIITSWSSDTDPANCVFYHKNPIFIMEEQQIGNVAIEHDIVELSFDLQLSPGFICDDGWCHILNTALTKGIRLPLIAWRPDGSIHVSISSNSGWISQNIGNHSILSLNDGNYHKLYLKFSYSKRTIIYDDTLQYNFDGNFEFSDYIGNVYPIFVADQNAYPPSNGYVKNLCINSYLETEPPTNDPTVDPTVDPTNHPTIDATNCVFYYPNPIDIVNDNYIGDITIADIVELSFHIKIAPGFTCDDGWCNILRVGWISQGTPRFPLIAVTPDGSIHVSITTTPTGPVASNIGNYTETPLNDGMWHKIYVKFSYSERIFMYDDKTYTFNGNYEFSNNVGNTYKILVAGSNVYQEIDGFVKNLCINTYYATNPPTHEPTTVPTYDPTSDPSNDPTYDPTSDPTHDPTSNPTNDPTYDPTMEPTLDPTIDPTIQPTHNPTPKIQRVDDETTTTMINTEPTMDVNNDLPVNDENIIFFLDNMILYVISGSILFLICCIFFIFIYKKRCNAHKKEEGNTGHRIERVISTSTVVMSTPHSPVMNTLIYSNETITTANSSSSNDENDHSVNALFDDNNLVSSLSTPGGGAFHAVEMQHFTSNSLSKVQSMSLNEDNNKRDEQDEGDNDIYTNPISDQKETTRGFDEITKGGDDDNTNGEELDEQHDEQNEEDDDLYLPGNLIGPTTRGDDL